MNFRSLLAASAAVLIGAVSMSAQVSAPAAAPAIKLAYIRSQLVLEQSPGRPEAEAAFQKEADEMLGEARKMDSTLQKAIADFRKAEPGLTAAQRDARTAALQTMQEQTQQKQQGLQRQYQARQAEFMQPIMAQIRLVLEDIRTAEGYAIIFDADAQGSGIVASDKNLDLTDRVIAKLRTMPRPALPGATAAPAAAGTKAPAGPVSAPAGVSRQKPPTE